jgi:hypothetical protein
MKKDFAARKATTFTCTEGLYSNCSVIPKINEYYVRRPRIPTKLPVLTNMRKEEGTQEPPLQWTYVSSP